MASDAPALKPILLLFPARSGSTLLMQLLGTSPKVVFDRVYPFENRYLSFLLRWAWQLADAGRRRDEWTVERLVQEEPFAGNAIEPPPFPMPRGFAVNGPRPLWHAAFTEAWREFCARARDSEICSPARDPAPVYYAEKTRSLFRYSLQELGIDHEVIYLLRDPRDIFQSIWSFNAKRGTSGFAVLEGDTPESFAKRFIGERKLRLRMLLEMVPHDPAATIVRYEEMITDLPAVAARLSARLRVALDAGQVQAQQGDFKGHMSAAGPKASIQRWRKEMPNEIQQAFAARLGEELTALGYEV